MNDQELVGALQASGCVTEENVARWREAAALMATLDAIGRDGMTAVVKIDGGRPDAIYTVLVSGSQLGESFFRKDGNDPLVLLRDAINFYKAEVWSKRL
ncbi:hypothetical protein [Variovorax sp. YR752]|uniref:hypothetical protein n=1 Tax=Variovorax sp. YR752 TaxID=1884383 RepID=UPI00117F3847|nr:hypothetical protein [Variovorax sp. YR752]